MLFNLNRTLIFGRVRVWQQDFPFGFCRLGGPRDADCGRAVSRRGIVGKCNDNLASFDHDPAQ
jgi:hypothetical protein